MPGSRQSVTLPAEVRQAASRGLRLLPLCRPDDSSRPEKERGKAPLLLKWQYRASADVAQIEAWAVQFPGCNWGMATGRGSGIFVLDIDGEPGIAALYSHAQEGRELTATLTVCTGRGQHLYFRYPQGWTIRNSAGQLSERLDIRGEGGYVVIPPSIHPSGALYAYVDQSAPIAEAPQWLLDRVAQPIHAGSSILLEGNRNDGLARFAGAMRRKGASKEQLENLLLDENKRRCRPPLDDTEVLNIASSISHYPPGGPDPLETAWANVLREEHATTYQKFLALARHLQLARPSFPIALPLERIGKLMGRNWTLVRRYRKRAVSEGLIREVKKCIPHRMAALYKILSP